MNSFALELLIMIISLRIKERQCKEKRSDYESHLNDHLRNRHPRDTDHVTVAQTVVYSALKESDPFRQGQSHQGDLVVCGEVTLEVGTL